mmetsp:Transcript_21073/g.45657  ORF Transcript_21073/g.45657 Transcript_21073/m.45657 type:complete len:113 (-) Transcript_21073:1016-1354(-)
MRSPCKGLQLAKEVRALAALTPINSAGREQQTMIRSISMVKGDVRLYPHRRTLFGKKVGRERMWKKSLQSQLKWLRECYWEVIAFVSSSAVGKGRVLRKTRRCLQQPKSWSP